MTTKPSILVVTELYPNVTNSFIGTFVVRQLELLKTRFTIVVITVHRIGLLKRRGNVTLQQPSYRQEQGVHVYSIPLMPFWHEWPAYLLSRISRRFMSFQFFDKLLTTHRILALARELHAQYVFSIVHGHETYIGDEAASVGRQLNIPSVFTLHGLYSYHRQLFGLKVVRRAVSNMNATDRLIAVSHLAAKSYQSQGVLRGFEIIPNGITPPAKSGRANPPLDIVAFIKQKFVILTVGFFAVEKRVDFSVKTLARLHRIGMDNAVLIIIGKGRRDEEAELRKLIDQEEVTDFVRIVGEVKPADMTTYYSIADVLLHPSIIESFSMVCLEAMSHGKPIICTSNIGLVEFLHLGKDSIVVPPDDLDAMFQAVLNLMKKPSLRQRIGQQARQTSAALSWTNQIRKVERVYEDLLAE